MRRLVPVLCLVLTACPPDEEEEPFDLAIDADTVEGYIVESSGGPTPHDVLVRAVNGYGAAVSATTADLQLGTSSRSVIFDGYGYGSLSVELPGAYDVVGAQAEGVTVYGVDADFAGLGWATAAEIRDDAREVIPVDGGFLIRGNTQVWWVEPGQRPVPMISMSDSIGGVFPCQLDFDGTVDVVVWAGSTLAMLKGRAEGGMSWAGGFIADGNQAIGAAACGDATGDYVSDVVIGWTDSTAEPSVMVLEGNGLWDFELFDELYIADDPTTMTIGDNAGTNRGQISVFTDEGDLVRYSISDSGTIYETGPNLSDTYFPSSPQLLPSMDMDGDGFEELVLVGMYLEGDERETQIWDLSGDVASRYNVNRDSAYLAMGDADGDGLGDLLSLTDDFQLSVVTFDGDQLVQHFVGETLTHGPIGISDTDGDGIAEFLVADADRWTMFDARLVESTNDLDEPYDQYRLISNEGTEIEGGMTGVVATGELDGDTSTAEWVHADLGVLQVMGVDASGEAVKLGQTALTDTSFVDIAVCGSEAWVIGPTKLARVDLSDPSSPVATEAAVPGADGVACQEGEGLVFDSSVVAIYDSNLVQTDTDSSGGAVDAALVRYDGATSEVVTCTAAACVLAVLENADGTQVLVEGSSRLLSYTDSSGTTELAGEGVPWVADVDGDGNEDAVVVLSGNVVSVYLNTGEGLAPAWYYHRGEGTSYGPVWALDYDGDGSRDLAVHDGAGSWWVSPEPSAEPTGGDTDSGDTEPTDTDSGDTAR